MWYMGLCMSQCWCTFCSLCVLFLRHLLCLPKMHLFDYEYSKKKWYCESLLQFKIIVSILRYSKNRYLLMWWWIYSSHYCSLHFDLSEINTLIWCSTQLLEWSMLKTGVLLNRFFYVCVCVFKYIMCVCVIWNNNNYALIMNDISHESINYWLIIYLMSTDTWFL